MLPAGFEPAPTAPMNQQNESVAPRAVTDSAPVLCNVMWSGVHSFTHDVRGMSTDYDKFK